MSGDQYRTILGQLALDGIPKVCIVCQGMIDPHPGPGRKPYTCGRVACRRVHRNMCVWRIRNRKSRTSMVERLKREGAM